MHPDDILSILNAKPFLPFDVELPNNTTFRVTDLTSAGFSPITTRDRTLVASRLALSQLMSGKLPSLY